MDIEVLKYLRDTFGTFKAFDCKRCSNAVECLNYRKFKGHCFQCALITYGDLFELNRSYRINPDSGAGPIVRKISKLNMLGFKMNVVSPLIIMYNKTSKKYVWIHPKKMISSGEIYDSIEINGNFMICKTGSKVSAYYIDELKTDLLYGLPDLGRMIPHNYYYSLSKELLWIKYSYMGKPCDLIADIKGNRVVVIGISKSALTSNQSYIMLEETGLNKSKNGFVRFNTELEPLNHSNGIMIMNM